MPEVIYIGLTIDAEKFLKGLNKLDGGKQHLHGRDLEMPMGKGAVDGKTVVARQQMQVNHNDGERSYVFCNLLIHNMEREYEAFSWSENPLLKKFYDRQLGQFNLERKT